MSKTSTNPVMERHVRGVNGARFTVVEEQLHGGLWRTMSITGQIRNVTAPRPEMRFALPGRQGQQDRGHLIAHRFGGPSDQASGNIVAMDYWRNEQGDWAQFEDTVAQFLGSLAGWMAVSVDYGPHPCRPIGFYAEVVFANGWRMTHRTKNYNLAITNLLSPENIANWGVNDPANFNDNRYASRR